MGYTAKLTIPKITENNKLKLYVYRSKNANDINTISKVASLQPLLIIDQDTAITTTINNKKYYVVEDKPTDDIGITYNGPLLNTIPITEYETEINLININSFTSVNELVLSPLPLTQVDGIIFYYSIIAVDEENNLMSHLSKVSSVLVNYVSSREITREVWSCNDYNDNDEDVWTLVNTLQYDASNDKINIGNIERPYNIAQLGIPMVETVPSIEEIKADVNSLTSNTYFTLQVQNPWQHNNEYFNYRKLKSYKVRNIYNSSYGEFSTPTFQSTLPVSIEKMVIMMKENPNNANTQININDEEAKKIEIIRRDGIFYESLKHKSYSYNPWIIPLEKNDFAVFSESSVQETINIQISGVMGNTYVFDVYLIDVYKNVSQNKHYVLTT